MRPTLGILLASAFGILASGPARAQEGEDKAALKEKILREVERRLKEEEERLLRDIERIVEEELRGSPAAERPARGYLGIRLDPLAPERRKELGITGGIGVAEVTEGSPAARAGLRKGDVILAVDGRSIESPIDIPVVLQAAGPGAVVKLEIMREGKKEVLEATLAAQPDEAPGLRGHVKKFMEEREEPPGRPPKFSEERDLIVIDGEFFDMLKEYLGSMGMDMEQAFEQGDDGNYRLAGPYADLLRSLDMESLKGLLEQGGGLPWMEPKGPDKEDPPVGGAWLGVHPEGVSEDLRVHLGLAEGAGLLIAEVVPGSPAEKAGLNEKDVFLRIDGEPVRGEPSLAGFMEKAHPGQEVTFLVLRKGKEQEVRVRLGARDE